MNHKSTLTSILRIWTTTLLAGILSYLYHPLMLKFMSVESFWEFSSMLGVFNILGVLTTGIGLFLLPKIAQQRADQPMLIWLYRWAFPRSLLLGVLVFLLFCGAIPLLQSYLQLPYALPLVLVGGSIVLAFASTVLSSFIQGMERFTFLGINSILWAFFKLIIGLGLAYLGYGVYAAVGGLLGAGILSFVIGFCYVFALLQPFFHQKNKNLNLDQDFLSEFWSFFHALLLSLVLAFFMNADLIMVRNLFDPKRAGIYGGISVVGKFIIYVLAAIETVYYPKISQHSAPKLVPFARLKNPFLLFLLAGAGALLGTWILWDRVLSLMKPELAGNTALLVLIVASCTLYGMLSFYAKILIAWKDQKTNYGLMLGALLIMLLCMLFPPTSLHQYVLYFTGVELALLCFLLMRIYFLKTTNEK